jgi:hypothetical protein
MQTLDVNQSKYSTMMDDTSNVCMLPNDRMNAAFELVHRCLVLPKSKQALTAEAYTMICAMIRTNPDFIR